MESIFLTLMLLSSSLVWAQDYPKPDTCDAAKVKSILAPRSGNDTQENLDCNLDLKPSDRITKNILIHTSGVTLNCHGATISVPKAEDGIQVNSKRISETSFVQTQDVTVKNCIIKGGVLVGGSVPRDSDQRPGHTERAQAAAPTRTLLSNLTILPDHRKSLHIFTGVTETTVIDSELGGIGQGTGVYLSPESARNTFRNNHIHTETSGEICFFIFCFSEDRELFSIDGSADNIIINNRFSNLNSGGIFLYRNCGEEGNVRHQTPSGNKIINNIFLYNSNEADKAAIWVGSRDGHRDFCDLDKKFDFGSGKDDRDFSKDNVIYQNQIQKNSVEKMLRIYDMNTNPFYVNWPNYVHANVSVNAPAQHKAGCFVKNAFPDPFLLHGQKTENIRDTFTGLATCSGKSYSCDDGVVSESNVACPTPPPSPKVVEAECRLEHSNALCKKSISCPANMKIAAIKVVSNLEYGEITEKTFDQAKWNSLSVPRPSTVTTSGLASAGEIAISSGVVSLADILGKNSTSFSCKEYDGNGGDCDIVVRVTCE